MCGTFSLPTLYINYHSIYDHIGHYTHTHRFKSSGKKQIVIQDIHIDQMNEYFEHQAFFILKKVKLFFKIYVLTLVFWGRN